jgi:hypothetical protein
VRARRCTRWLLRVLRGAARDSDRTRAPFALSRSARRTTDRSMRSILGAASFICASAWVHLAAAAATTAATGTGWSLPARQQAACNVSAPIDELCESFCSNECAFFNATAGEKGTPETVTVYRVTPNHITDMVNKDAGDPNGDLSFFLSRHDLRQECAQDSHAHGNGCFLAGDNVIVQVLNFPPPRPPMFSLISIDHTACSRCETY